MAFREQARVLFPVFVKRQTGSRKSRISETPFLIHKTG